MTKISDTWPSTAGLIHLALKYPEMPEIEAYILKREIMMSVGSACVAAREADALILALAKRLEREES